MTLWEDLGGFLRVGKQEAVPKCLQKTEEEQTLCAWMWSSLLLKLAGELSVELVGLLSCPWPFREDRGGCKHLGQLEKPSGGDGLQPEVGQDRHARVVVMCGESAAENGFGKGPVLSVGLSKIIARLVLVSWSWK